MDNLVAIVAAIVAVSNNAMTLMIPFLEEAAVAVATAVPQVYSHDWDP